MSDYEPPQSADEVLVRYRNGERYFASSPLDMQGVTCDFQGLDLRGINFSGSFLYADFRGADLKNANFDHCSVKTCDFCGADLQGATFRHAPLDGAEFSGALMSEADFEGATCSGYSMQAGELPGWYTLCPPI